MRRGWLRWGAPLGVLAVVVAALAATGALAPRDDLGAPDLEPGAIVETDRATIVVDGVEADGESVTATLTATSRLADPLRIDALARLVDDEGELATYSLTATQGTAVAAFQPGVRDTVTLTWAPERPIVGELRVEVLDATLVPRDETGFGLGSAMYDERVVGVVRVP